MGSIRIKSIKSASQATSLISASGLLIVAFTVFTFIWTRYSGLSSHTAVGVSCSSCSNLTAISPSTDTPEAPVDFRPPPGAEGPGNTYFAVCTLVKDEPDLREFLYHYIRHYNVSNVYIYDHGSSPSVEAIVKDYIATGRVEVIPWHDGVEERVRRLKAGKKGMENALHDAFSACADRLQKTPAKHSWIGFFDGDEYLWLNPKWMALGGLEAFLKQYENAGALGINWVYHGSSGKIRRAVEGVRHGYLSCTPDTQHHIKSILHIPNGVYAKLSHYFQLVEGKEAVSELHENIPNGGPFSPSYSVENISLHHYVLKSQEDFAKKSAKGAGDNTKKDWNFFHLYDEMMNETCDQLATWE